MSKRVNMKNKLSKLINDKINNLGYKDYINAVRKNPNEYGYIFKDEKLVRKILQDSQDKKTNVYKNKIIPNKPLSPEWKQCMRNHFIDMLRSK